MATEQRIKAHFRALRETFYQAHGTLAGDPTKADFNEVWLELAAAHNMPVKRVKEIVNGRV